MRNLSLITFLLMASAGGALAASPPANGTRVSVMLAESLSPRAAQPATVAAAAETAAELPRSPDAPRRKVRVILGSPYGN